MIRVGILPVLTASIEAIIIGFNLTLDELRGCPLHSSIFNFKLINSPPNYHRFHYYSAQFLMNSCLEEGHSNREHPHRDMSSSETGHCHTLNTLYNIYTSWLNIFSHDTFVLAPFVAPAV
eukprot:gene24871-biopygen10269